MKDYVSVVYDEKRTPRTDYPSKLVLYLFNRFNLKEKQKLLEIGCGRGEFLTAFQKLGLDCYGADMCDSSVKISGKLDVKKTDISKDKLPFEDNTFDIVYHKSLIEHLHSPINLMEETLRVLKPGGITIILTPDWASQMKVFYEDFTHFRPYDMTSLRDLLEIKGFSNVSSELFYQLPLVWHYPFLKVFSKLLQLFISTPKARKLTKITKIKFIRWSVELMVLGVGYKLPSKDKGRNEER